MDGWMDGCSFSTQIQIWMDDLPKQTWGTSLCLIKNVLSTLLLRLHFIQFVFEMYVLMFCSPQKNKVMSIRDRGPSSLFLTQPKDHEITSLNFIYIFPIKYVIPKSFRRLAIGVLSLFPYKSMNQFLRTRLWPRKLLRTPPSEKKSRVIYLGSTHPWYRP